MLHVELGGVTIDEESGLLCGTSKHALSVYQNLF